MKGLILVLIVPALLVLLGVLLPFEFTVTWVWGLVGGFLFMLATFMYCRRATRWMNKLPGLIALGIIVLIAIGPSLRAIVYPILNGSAWGGAAGYVVEVIRRWNDWIEMTESMSSPWLEDHLRRLRRS